jgi:FkbM family methyltransferase
LNYTPRLCNSDIVGHALGNRAGGRLTVIKQFIRVILKSLGLGITSYSHLAHLEKRLSEVTAENRDLRDAEFISTLGSENSAQITNLLPRSNSQLRQDLFVLTEYGFKRQGYFVEFGATNGVDLSNSRLLAEEFDWKGILVEPAKVWINQLRLNRPESHIETLCVWKETGSKIDFVETDASELSTLKMFSDRDVHGELRRKGKTYEVSTISLNDLLKKYHAPKQIDYLSIDTEGSEFEILNAFDFSEHSFGVITVEHNHTLQRELIYTLLTSKGYKRVYETISNIDDWYIKT